MKVYDDNTLSERELMFALPSMIIGVAVFTLPSNIAQVTEHGDGWISILVAGIIFSILAYLSAKIAASFPSESFLSYCSILVTKPVAFGITFCIGIVSIFIGAYIVRSLAFITQQYLFEKTPMEVIALCFLLVVIYAVAGTRAGIFRLNILFLPIILLVYFLVILFNIPTIDIGNYLPLFKTDVTGYGKGIIQSAGAFAGFGILLFYITFVKKPKKLAKIAFIGIGLSTIFYIIVFLTSIGIFGQAVVSNLNFPTVELSKRIDIPGGILERVDALVFTIWIMSIFNTSALIYDVALLQFSSLFNIKKINLILIIAPIVFYIAMFPQTTHQFNRFSMWLGYSSVTFTSLVIIILFILAKFRGDSDHVKN